MEDVVFTGALPNVDVKNAYAAADVVVLTSEYEPFGYCLLEAMSLSKPAVAFDIGAVSEIIADGVSGYAVEFADTGSFAEKVAQLFGDKSLASRMGSAGRGIVGKRFLLEDNANKLIKVYGELTG